MIVWLDGTYGVGKSSVASLLVEKLSVENIAVLHSDKFFIDVMRKKLEGSIGGMRPQNNLLFISEFREKIEQCSLDNYLIVIVDMALTADECKTGLYDYFLKKNIPNIHVILQADSNTIINRIEMNDGRDKLFAKEWLDYNIKYLENNYKTATQINTDGKTVDEIAKEIVLLIQGIMEGVNDNEDI